MKRNLAMIPYYWTMGNEIDEIITNESDCLATWPVMFIVRKIAV